MEKVKSEHRVDIDINISDKEREIFDTLMKVVHDNDLKTTLRVAGGWVRDKVSMIYLYRFVDYGKGECGH